MNFNSGLKFAPKTMLIIFSILLLLLIAVFPIAAVIVGARAEREMRKIMQKEREKKN